MDAGIQDTVRLALKESVEKFNAEGAAAVLMNAKTGEVVALVSLPDFDPNNLRQAKRKSLFNAATLGVYEVGSIMKLFNAAIGLETGKVKVSDTFDAANPIVLANYKIQDEPKLRRVFECRIGAYCFECRRGKTAGIFKTLRIFSTGIIGNSRTRSSALSVEMARSQYSDGRLRLRRCGNAAAHSRRDVGIGERRRLSCSQLAV